MIWPLLLVFVAGTWAGVIITVCVRIYSDRRDRITGSAGHF